MTKCLLAGLLFLAPSLGLAAELHVPEQFDVLMVNGKEFPTTLSRTKTVSLSAGRNVVIIEFDKIYDAEFGDSHDRVHSAPFALVFSAAATDQLQLIGPVLSSGAEAKRYVKAPTVQVLTTAKQPISVQQLPVTEMNGLLLADNTVASPAPTATPTMVSEVKANVAGTSSPPERPAAPTTTVMAPDVLQMLSYWWQQATPEQRAEFLRQINR